VGSSVLSVTTLNSATSTGNSTTTTASKGGTLPGTGLDAETGLRIGACIFAVGVLLLLIKRFHPGIFFGR
jgi:hypothetical protein